MNNTYTIGEVASMLGITIDAIRFYEKKGLVHPQVNPKNKYRLFTIANILELLDVIYYREFDLSISEIRSVLQSGTKESMQCMLKEKKDEAKQRIKYETEMIQKIEYLENIFQIFNQKYEIQIKSFPKTRILSQHHQKEEMMKSQISDFNKDCFVMSCLYSSYDLYDGSLKDLYMTIEEETMIHLDIEYDQFELLSLNQCLYAVVPFKNTTLNQSVLTDLLEYAKTYHLECENTVYVHEIPLTAYSDQSTYYAELYLPIKIT